jgi:hypothetical protein
MKHLDHNSTAGDFEKCVGEELHVVAFGKTVNKGEIVRIDTSVDGYGHESSYFVTDLGYRYNCQHFAQKPVDTTTVKTYKMEGF